MPRATNFARQHFVRSHGFTLLEILVAIAIFAVVGMLAMGGYNELVQQSDRINQSMQRTRAIQMTMMRFTQDFAELEPRPIREPLGSGSLPALFASYRAEALVELTRAGWSNPAALPRPTMQRVAYRLVNGTLYRDYWPVLDRMLSSEATQVALLDHVNSVKLRFMTQGGQWQDEWPALSRRTQPNIEAEATAELRQRPLAVEVTMELEDWGTLVRLIEISG